MAITDVDVINNALARFAGGRIAALQADTDLNQIVEPIYRDIVGAAFALWDWRFNRRTRRCEPLTETIFNGWTRVHSFPAGMADKPALVLANPRRPDDPLREFAIEGRRIYSDQAELWAAGPFKIDPDEWPDTFRDGVTHWCSAEFVVPVTHDTNLAAQMRMDALGSPSEGGRGGRMGRAIAVDVARGGMIPNAGASDPFTAAHNGGGSSWYGDN